MERPDLDKVKRPVDEIKKAIDHMTEEEKKELRERLGMQAETPPTGSAGS